MSLPSETVKPKLAEFATYARSLKGDEKGEAHVPRAYLANFSDKNGKIWMYDKAKRIKANPKITGVAAEKFFYDSETMKQVTGDKQFVEKRLGELEGNYAAAVKDLLHSIETGHYKGIHGELRHFLSVFMAVQMIRTKEHRILIGEASRYFDALAPELLRDNATPDDIVDQHLDWILDGKRIGEDADILHGHAWTLQKSYKDEVFYTSDNPVERKAHAKIPGSWMSMSGISSPGIEIVLPISLTYLLVLYERSFHPHMARLENRVVELLCTENMEYANTFQVEFSNRFVFSRTEDFSFLEMVLSEQPHLGNSNRRRISDGRDRK